MDSIIITTIIFNNNLSNKETTFFRGALLNVLNSDDNMCLHNHIGEGLRYGYPLVQYKSLNGKAAVVAVGDIGDYLEHELSCGSYTLRIGKREEVFEVAEVTKKRYLLKIDDAPKHYSISGYLPLTDKNYAQYKSLVALTDKICFIENVLVGNILSFLKGIGVHVEERLHIALTGIEPVEDSVYKGISFKTYNLRFVSNIELPDNVGLGKSASVGHGTLKRMTNK